MSDALVALIRDRFKEGEHGSAAAKQLLLALAAHADEQGRVAVVDGGNVELLRIRMQGLCTGVAPNRAQRRRAARREGRR